METALSICPLPFKAGLFISEVANIVFILHWSRIIRSCLILLKFCAHVVSCSPCQGPNLPHCVFEAHAEFQPALLSSFLFVIFWDLLKSADVEQEGKRYVHLFCLTRRWNFYFLSGLTLKVWRTTWKTRWTSPNLGADLLRTCTEAVIYPHQLATAFPALADTRLYGKAFNQAVGDPQTVSAQVRRVNMFFPIRIFFIFPLFTV